MLTFNPPAEPDARRAGGRARRQQAPRSTWADWRPAKDRADPVAALLAANTGRLPDLLPLKWGRMAASPFAFFRGATALFAADLAGQTTSGLTVQLCGDAHLRNLGAYAAADDGHLVFDLNDFDETLPDAPWEWDLLRLVASVVLAGHEAGQKDGDTRAAAAETVRAYRETLDEFASLPARELFQREVRLKAAPAGPVRDLLERSRRADAARNLAKLTEPGPDGWPRFHDASPLLCHVADAEAAAVLASLAAYRLTLTAGRRLLFDRYRAADVAFKVVGTGSVGTRDYVVLFFGPGGKGDALFLQVKEEPASAHAPFLPAAARSAPPHDGQRVAEGQLRSQTATDLLVGWTTVDGRAYLVRQLADHKAAVDPATLTKASDLAAYAAACARVLAKAHARTGDPAALAGYVGGSDTLDQAVAAFAAAYATQTIRDHQALRDAIAAQRLVAIEPPST